jgi:DNA-binding response OmpR family regulator
MSPKCPTAERLRQVGSIISRPRSLMAVPQLDVLVVEDDALTSTLLVEGLHAVGLTTDVAGTVLEAKRLLSRERYSVVVLDLVLPDGTGFDILDFMKAEKLRIQVVVVTAADALLVERLDRSLVKTVIFKPFDVRAVTSYLRMLSMDRSRPVE